MEKIQNCTYIVKCSDGTYYTGWTNCIEKRLNAHNSGKGAKYTRSRYPVELAYLEVFETKQEAMSREVKIKQLTRKQKEELIRAYQGSCGGRSPGSPVKKPSIERNKEELHGNNQI